MTVLWGLRTARTHRKVGWMVQPWARKPSGGTARQVGLSGLGVAIVIVVDVEPDPLLRQRKRFWARPVPAIIGVV